MSNFVEKAKNYKKNVASRYIAIEADAIPSKLSHFNKYLASIKYDGHFYALAYEDEKAMLINRNGKVVERVHFHEEIEAFFKSKNIKKIFVAGELYVQAETRTRQFNVSTALTEDSDDLRFAAFDIMELEDTSFFEQNAFERLDTLKEIFPSDGHFHLVEHIISESTAELQEYFKEKVDIDNHEGIVVKTEGFTTFKVKPKFTFDAVIVGFAQGDGERSDLLRDFLLAFRKDDGSYQIFAHLSHGFNDDQRRELLAEYKEKVVPSNYLEVARNRLGFQMVKPETVVEFSCIDVINEDSKGNIKKMNLSYDEEKGYTSNFQQPTISVTIPVFQRFREDKKATVEDTNFSQVLEIVSFDEQDTKTAKLAESEIIRREVYKKESKAAVMVKKFLIIKTGKEESGEYPGFVFHLTDYSSGRKDPLKKDVKVSDSKTQIEEIFDAEILKNIKKGWEKVEEVPAE